MNDSEPTANPPGSREWNASTRWQLLGIAFALTVMGIGFDRFIYLPKQNYPERGWGGVLERIGTWAYVHE